MSVAKELLPQADEVSEEEKTPVTPSMTS